MSLTSYSTAEGTKIASNGPEALFSCHTQIRRRGGGALKLARLNIEHLRLNTVFEVFLDEQDAVNSFFPDRAVRHTRERADPAFGFFANIVPGVNF